jgi:uncharacterized protein YvpB
MKLEVPYYSQFTDVNGDPYWMPRACGMVCLKTILDYHHKETPTLLQMCEDGKREGGYGPSGWFHDYFVKVAKGYGLNSERGEKIGEILGLQKIHDELKSGNPVIVSVTKYTLGQKKFHMVVLTGYEENDGIEFPERKGQLTGFYFNEPESLSSEQGKDLFVDIKSFKHDWRRMAIFFKP